MKSLAARKAFLVRFVGISLVLFLSSYNLFAYSVLTHEEIVDLLWLDEIRPLLLKKYPGLTEQQIKEAHAYAYGGAVIQDLGYYPFGSADFSDLAHYVRSGDFVLAMLKGSQDQNEYAFALGALAHYTSDITGHPAVNHSVAIEYPKLRAKFGESVRYAQVPKMTQVALQTLKKDLMREHPNFAKKQFLYHLSRSSYEKEWGRDYTKPGCGTRILSTLFRLVPKIGPFKGLAFNNPTPQTEDLYIKSIDATVVQYRAYLKDERSGKLALPNADFDTGQLTKPAEYSLTDDAYANLLSQLAKRNFSGTSAELRANILDFYSDPSLPIHTKRDKKAWSEVLEELDKLKAYKPSTAIEIVPTQ